MTIPTLQQWKDATKGNVFQTRSKLLKDVDTALGSYNTDPSAPNKKVLREALRAWMDTKDDWATSLRNRKGAVQDLWNAVQPYRTGGTTPTWTAPPLPTAPVAGEFYLSQSFEFSNSLARTEVPKALNRAKGMINQAYLGINTAKSGPNRTIYERWFGAYDQARWQKVRDNIKDVYDALWLKPVILYFRGEGVSGPNDCPAEAGDLTPGSYFGAAWKPQHLPSSLDSDYTYIFLGKAFFTADIYRQDSTGGVIIHELTHAICGTDDVVYKGETTYGATLCRRLATERPALAINNADSYEYLCENYQNKLFQPKDIKLNLPPKASIVLDMRTPT
jgi:hypothetical protein